MKGTLLSRFTPSLMKHEDLEEMLVQRHDFANELVESIRQSILKQSEQHHLLIGMRGIGKTHLVSLMYYRVSKMEDLREKVLIAWLREEEWGVTSFLDLLLRILRSLQSEYRDEYNAKLFDRVESLYNESPDTAQQTAAELLKDFAGDRTLFLLVENLDDLFEGLGDSGQQQFRDYLENTHFCTIFATSQHLFKGIDNKKAPFYNFFNRHDLENLNLDQVVCLLKNIAKLEDNKELELFIETAKGRSRIEAIHHLAGGNHRVYMIFAEFLTRDSLDLLVKPFLQTLDELTPYYQARMAWLSPQQRKIIEFLCNRRGAVMVKDIARRCFMTHQTASSQLKQLSGMGYVTSESIGRESYYEIREVLMRFCMDVKKHRGEPISLIVDFLRLWYTQEELKQRLDRLGVRFSAIGKELVDRSYEKSQLNYQLSLETLPPNALAEREYLLRALQPRKTDDCEDSRVAACVREIENFKEKKDYFSALNLANKLVAIRGKARDWLEKGRCLHNLERYDEALECYDRAIDLNANYHPAWALQGNVLNHLERYEEALVSFDKAIKLGATYHSVWVLRGNVLNHLERYEEALVSFDKAIKLGATYHSVWALRGYALDNLKHYEEALSSLDRAIELGANYQELWVLRGNVLNNLGRYEEALASLDRTIELDANNQLAWAIRGIVLNSLKRDHEALASLDRAIEFDDNNQHIWVLQSNVLKSLKRYHEALIALDWAIELDANYQSAWANRGNVLNNLKCYDEALASLDCAIELDANDAWAWANRGNVLYNLKRYDEALASYDRAIELKYDDRLVWVIRGYLLNNLKRYEEALISCDRAIELNYQDSPVFFNRAIAILGLNRWDEGIAALDDAFQRLESDDEVSSKDAELIIRNLFANTHDTTISQTRITSLITVYEKHNHLSILGQGIVRNIPALMSEMVSDKAARTWLELWQETTSNYEQFQIPMRLLNAAVRYKQTKGDRRVLLELPIEERNLLEPLVSGKVE
ncbi:MULTISPECIES: tetratricopeptide repeat protein [unclassified Microcoleus]|uniref:tetratricopeptide repeat protein n=1 Tax=unclassified Microcoleus TaxID=2642155 RepID=UPI0026002641|nr:MULTISPECIES: tetratricopeptide repeat protein [unclassified Microcoleus]